MTGGELTRRLRIGKRWARSALCRTTPPRFRPSLKNWFAEEMFDADESGWSHEYSGGDSDPAAHDEAETNRQTILAMARKQDEAHGKR